MDDSKLKIIFITGIIFLTIVSFLIILIITNRGSLEVKTDPSDATVFIDGTEKGKTPLVIKNVKTGKHILEIKKDGYTDIKKGLEIKRGKTKTEEVLERGLPSITKELPKNTEKYIIEYSIPNPKNYTDLTYKITIKATLNKITPETWEKYKSQQRDYKKEALDWLKDKGVDIEKSKIEYIPKEVGDL